MQVAVSTAFSVASSTVSVAAVGYHTVTERAMVKPPAVMIREAPPLPAVCVELAVTAQPVELTATLALATVGLLKAHVKAAPESATSEKAGPVVTLITVAVVDTGVPVSTAVLNTSAWA
eukprot:500859-Pyramimonas_sp.AAC.1